METLFNLNEESLIPTRGKKKEESSLSVQVIELFVLCLWNLCFTWKNNSTRTINGPAKTENNFMMLINLSTSLVEVAIQMYYVDVLWKLHREWVCDGNEVA